jgi:hypothetical protein
MKLLRLLPLVALLALVPRSPAADPVCDQELVKLINDYRKKIDLPAIPISPALTKVAHTHLQDLIKNKPHVKSKNITAWSDKGKWTPGVPGQGGKQSWTIMWYKPREIADYEGLGFEMAFYGFGTKATVKEAMNLWTKDKSCLDLLRNEGRFKQEWKGIGAARGNGFYLVWFGQ